MPFFRKSPKTNDEVDWSSLPRHIAIIMDGNGRWAKQRGLPRTAGHAAGAETFRTIATYCKEIGIEYLTVYAFSTENWKRPKDEVDAIMELLEQYVDEAYAHKEENQNVRTRFVGDLSALNPTLQQKLERIQKLGEGRTGLMVDVAFNYGGRNEIAHAARCIAQQVKEGKLTPEQITEQTVEQNLYTAGVPDPDLIIRPSGEQRLSNFLIWQSAYSEYVFMDVLWPDFTPEHLEQAIAAFHQRQRRFGGI